MFLHQHKCDESRMFFLGTLDQTVTMMLFDKGSINIDSTLKIKRQDANGVDKALPKTKVNEIQSYVKPMNEGAVYDHGKQPLKTQIRYIKGKDEPLEVNAFFIFRMSN